MRFEKVKIVVYVPEEAAELIRSVLAAAGAGNIGRYSNCSFTSLGTGRYKPEKGSSPVIGEVGRCMEVREEKIEVICPVTDWKSILIKVKEAHPYEEPAIDVIPLLN